jgi:SAM-dependent methyltransferase
LYKEDLLAQLLQFHPSSVLDVGSGAGDLLTTLGRAGVRGCGIEPDLALVRDAAARGLDVRSGRAESLPFGQSSFDVVVFDYTAHHIEDLPAALREAARVARSAIVILDPWYDDSIDSQRVARSFDEWLKKIDRRGGMIHNDCLTAAELVGPLSDLNSLDFRITYRLELRHMSEARFESAAASHLSSPDCDEELKGEFDSIREKAASSGISEDGAILFSAGCS